MPIAAYSYYDSIAAAVYDTLAMSQSTDSVLPHRWAFSWYPMSGKRWLRREIFKAAMLEAGGRGEGGWVLILIAAIRNAGGRQTVLCALCYGRPPLPTFATIMFTLTFISIINSNSHLTRRLRVVGVLLEPHAHVGVVGVIVEVAPALVVPEMRVHR